MNEVPFGLTWPDGKERFARFREAVKLIRALWTEERVSFDGEYYSTDRATIYNRPDHPVPIWLAASGPAATRFAGRLALPEEYDRIAELTVRAYSHDGSLGGSGYAERLRDAAGRAEMLVAIAPDTQTLLGAVTFTLADGQYAEVAVPGEAEFRMLAVSPEHRSAGVGATLVRACLDRAVTSGSSAVVISVKDDALVARRLYEREHFRRDTTLDWSPIAGVQLLGYRQSVQVD